MAYNLNGITDISDFINYGKGLSLSKADLYLKEKTQSGIIYNATLIKMNIGILSSHILKQFK